MRAYKPAQDPMAHAWQVTAIQMMAWVAGDARRRVQMSLSDRKEIVEKCDEIYDILGKY